MAGRTFKLKDASATGYGTLTEATATAGTMGSGWTVATTTANAFSTMLYGTTRAANTFTTGVDQLSTQANFATGQAWRTDIPIHGTFSSGTNWSLAFSMIAVSTAASQTGRIKVRIWKSSDPVGATANQTQLTIATAAGFLTGTTAAFTKATAGTSTVTWTPTGIAAFDNEYLFVSCEWNTVVAGTRAGSDAIFVATAASRVITSDFTATTTAATAAETLSLADSATAKRFTKATATELFALTDTATATQTSAAGVTVMANVVEEPQTIFTNLYYDPSAVAPAPIRVQEETGIFNTDLPTITRKLSQAALAAMVAIPFVVVPTPRTFVDTPDDFRRQVKTRSVEDIAFVKAPEAAGITSTITGAFESPVNLSKTLVYDVTAGPTKEITAVTTAPALVNTQNLEFIKQKQKFYQLSSFVFAIPDDDFGYQISDNVKTVSKKRIVDDVVQTLRPPAAPVATPDIFPDYLAYNTKTKHRNIVPEPLSDLRNIPSAGITTTITGAFESQITITRNVPYDLTIAPVIIPVPPTPTPSALGEFYTYNTKTKHRNFVPEPLADLRKPAPVPYMFAAISANQVISSYFIEDQIVGPDRTPPPAPAPITITASFDSQIIITRTLVYDLTAGPVLTSFPQAVVDTHDGIRKKRKKRRDVHDAIFAEEQRRKDLLRQQLLEAYRGIQHEQLHEERVALDAIEPIPQMVFDALERAGQHVDKLVAEYNNLLAKEKARKDAEDEEEIELILMSLL